MEAVKIVYNDGKKALVPSDAGSLKVTGFFRVTDRPEFEAGTIDMEITNVIDGSGTAKITTPNTFTLDAGSTGNTIVVEFEASGTMDGGEVLLEIQDTQDTWGNLSEISGQDNHIAVTARPRSATPRSVSVGDDFVLVYLETFGKGDTLIFTLQGVTAQNDIETTAFRVFSAGSAAGTREPLAGEDNPDGDDADRLLGAVYKALFDFDGDGVAEEDPRDEMGALRIKVAGGGAGEGTVTFDIIETTEGLNTYLTDADDDGTYELERTLQVHAGDTGTYLEFTYTPVETIAAGELRFTAPTDWDPRSKSIAQGMPVIPMLIRPMVQLVAILWTEIRSLSRSFNSTRPLTLRFTTAQKMGLLQHPKLQGIVILSLRWELAMKTRRNLMMCPR